MLGVSSIEPHLHLLRATAAVVKLLTLTPTRVAHSTKGSQMMCVTTARGAMRSGHALATCMNQV